MAYTLEKIKEEFSAACESVGVKLQHPISLNGRLSNTLGRVKYRVGVYDGEARPDCIEFSTKFVTNGADEDIHRVILHEAAHYIVTVQTKRKHGHDKVFKAMCARLGTDNDCAQTDLQLPIMKKYMIMCPTCNKTIGGYDRMCKTIKMIENHDGSVWCKTCGCRDLKVWRTDV